MRLVRCAPGLSSGASHSSSPLSTGPTRLLHAAQCQREARRDFRRACAFGWPRSQTMTQSSPRPLPPVWREPLGGPAKWCLPARAGIIERTAARPWKTTSKRYGLHCSGVQPTAGPRSKGDGRVAQPFSFCPHRSGRAAFPHPALPEGNPHHAVLAVQGCVIRGSGRGKRSSIASNLAQASFRAFWLRRRRQRNQMPRTDLSSEDGFGTASPPSPAGDQAGGPGRASSVPTTTFQA